MIQRPCFATRLACTPVLLLLAALTLPVAPAGFAAETTVYVNEFFEVRDDAQPTKYVFNGDTRVARVTGSLSAKTRVQRLGLNPGWNLRSLAVTAPEALHQLTNSHPFILGAQSIFQWSAQGATWLPVLPDQTLPAGTVLWLHATTNTTLAISGVYADPTNRPVAGGGAFVSGTGLETLTLPSAGADLAFWQHDAANQVWQVHALAVPSPAPPFPRVLAPGEAAFVDASAPVELETPPAALRVRYYHPDHLGSSAVMTDADGAIVEETAFYPFGVERHAHRPRQIQDSYQFTAKERDRESGLDYFEARYLAGPIARFISPDPKYARLDDLSDEDLASFLSSPHEINPYQYGLNNPLKYNDPTGLDKVETVAKASDVVGIAGGATEEAAIWAYRAMKNPPGWVKTGAGAASKATAVVSVGIKAAQFYDDPSYATGGQLANESAKALVGIAAPPVGLIWSVLDLTGYGPSAILESTEKSIKANREATMYYQQATEASRQTVALVNQAEPKIRAKMKQADAKLQQLVKATDKLNQTTRKSLRGETRSLKELNDAIRKQEQINRRTMRELRRVEARARQLQK